MVTFRWLVTTDTEPNALCVYICMHVLLHAVKNKAMEAVCYVYNGLVFVCTAMVVHIAVAN